MERVLEHDLRRENLGFSVIIFSDKGQATERHTVTCRVSPITSASLLNTPHAYQRCTNRGGHSTGSPLVRTPR
jgi:hypothetical protein